MKQVREILTETIENGCKKNDAEEDPKAHYEDIASKSTGRFDSNLFQCRTLEEAIPILRVVLRYSLRNSEIQNYICVVDII